MTASQRLSSRIASPPGSLTWKVSRATPSARVSICAERMLTPWAASVPAISAKSPAVSRVTTTKSEAPRSGRVEHLGHGRLLPEPVDQPEVGGHALGRRRADVAVRHRLEVPLRGLPVGRVRQGLHDPLGHDRPARRLREAPGELRPRPRVERAQERPPPRVPHARADRPDVRAGEEVEHREPRGKARDRRQPLRGLRVVDVPALGRVREAGDGARRGTRRPPRRRRPGSAGASRP